jgi:hypothetical protein
LFVKKTLPGERNGKAVGKMFCIAQNDAKKVKAQLTLGKNNESKTSQTYHGRSA